MWERIACMGKMDRAYKFILKIRVYCGFNIAYPVRNPLGLSTFVTVEQRNSGTVAGSVADSINFLEIAVGYQAQYHRLFGVDVAAKCARQYNPVYLGDICVFH